MKLINDIQVFYPGRVIKLCQLDEYHNNLKEEFYTCLEVKELKKQHAHHALIVLKGLPENNKNAFLMYSDFQSYEELYFYPQKMSDDYPLKEELQQFFFKINQTLSIEENQIRCNLTYEDSIFGNTIDFSFINAMIEFILYDRLPPNIKQIIHHFRVKT